MLPQTPSKADLRNFKTENDILHLMGKHLERWGVKDSKTEAFLSLYMDLVVDKVTEGEVRLPLPQNLGYLQVLQHQLEIKTGKRAHLEKYGNSDFNLLWIKHPMFRYHEMKFNKEARAMVLAKRLGGAKYLKEYVDGDFYVA